MNGPGRNDHPYTDASGSSTRSRWGIDRFPGGRRALWIALGVLIVLFIGWRIYTAAGPARTPRFGMGGAQAVGVAKAVSGDMDITLDALGTVTPLATVTVRPQVGGQIVKIFFTEGQLVKAGDPLVQIDPRPFQATLDQAKGQLARDSASLRNAELDLKRFAALHAQNAISQQQFATQQALVQSDSGVVAADQANVRSAAINLGYARVVSPVDGRAGLRLVDIGNMVTAGQSGGIVVVTQEQPISVLFSLPEDDIGDVMSRLGAGARLSVAAYDRGQTAQLATGTLAAVDSQIDTTTGTVKARAMFDNSDGKLFPQQFVNVRLLVNTLHDQTLVPVAAVQRGAEGNYVYVVLPDKTVAQRTVTLGPGNATTASIAQGLKPGDVVVVDGADRLRDGASVAPSGAPVPVTAPSAAPSGTAGAPDAERAARRAKMAAAMKQYCGADIAKYCAGMTPGSQEMRMCFFQNHENFSDGCQSALKKIRKSMGGRGGGGFGGGGP